MFFVKPSSAKLTLTDPDWPRLALTDPDWPRLIKTDQDWPRPTHTDQDWPRLTKTVQDRPRLTNTDQDWQRLTKTDQEWPRLNKTEQDWPRLIKTDQDWRDSPILTLPDPDLPMESKLVKVSLNDYWMGACQPEPAGIQDDVAQRPERRRRKVRCFVRPALHTPDNPPFFVF